MNYLITTFDGIGDGVIYFPVFNEIGGNLLISKFFYTSNLFFKDSGIANKIKLPSNFQVIDNNFRKFPKEHWETIYNFIGNNNIKTVINLRFIGGRFEKNYYDFKEWVSLKNSDIVFFDEENLQKDEKLNVNVRNIVVRIIEKALKIKISYNSNTLKEVFQPNKQAGDILINLNSRGAFKQWEIDRWIELISSLALSNKKIKIYEGFGDTEKTYTRGITKNLQSNIRNKIEIINPNNLDELIGFLRDTFLLVSVDSGLVHLADSMGVDSLGLYITTSPKMWGGITDKFHYIESKHMSNCKNFYPYFGMCMNNKIKCEEVFGEKDDISVPDVLRKAKKIFYEKN